MLKNTASQVISFHMLNTSDGSDVTTGTPTVYVTKDGGTQASGGGTSTHEGNGEWSYAPTQAETNADHVAFTMVLSGAFSQTINVYPSSIDYTDSVRGGMTALPNAAADAAGGLPISDAGGLDMDAILVDTAALNDTKIPDTLSLANINSEVDTALTDIHLDHLLAADYDPASPPGTSTALLNELIENDGGVSRFTVNALEQAPSGGGGLTAADIADAVWDEAAADHTTGTSFGGYLYNLWGDWSNGGRLDLIVDGILADTAELQEDWANGGRLDLILDARASQSSVDTIDGVVDSILVDTNELQADWADGGRLDLILDAVATQSSVDTIDSNVDAILVDTNELQTDWTNGGRLDLLIDAILVDTGTDIPASITALNDLSAAEVNSEVDSAIVTYGLDHVVSASVTGTDVADNSIIAKLVSKSATADWDSFNNTTDSLEANADAMSAGLEVDVTKIHGSALTETTSGRLAANASTFFDNADSASSKVQDDIGTATVSGGLEADLVSIKGTALTETTAGRLAANASTFFDNNDAASTKVQDDVGTASVSGTINANVTQFLGTAITETTSGRIAANVSTLFDNGDAASTKTQDDIGAGTVTGVVQANLTQIKGTAITETTAGRLAQNASVFFDNADAASTKTQDDVGVAGTVDANVTQYLGTAITESTSGRIAGNVSVLFNNGDAASTKVQDDIGTSGAGGSGAYTVTINVKDTESSPANLENVTVRLSEGSNTFVQQTDANGDAVFALDAATYDYALTKNGYNGETGTTVVSDTATFNYDIALNNISASSGSLTSTGVLTVRDEEYAAESGVDISIQLTAGPGVAGEALDTAVRTETSDVSGLVQFTNMIRGATYNVWRSDASSSVVFGTTATSNSKVSYVVPDSASHNLPELLGTE